MISYNDIWYQVIQTRYDVKGFLVLQDYEDLEGLELAL